MERVCERVCLTTNIIAPPFTIYIMFISRNRLCQGLISKVSYLLRLLDYNLLREFSITNTEIVLKVRHRNKMHPKL